MVAIIHNNGWAVSNKSKFDTAFDGKKHTPTIVIEDLFNAYGKIDDGAEVDIYCDGRSLTGVVYRAGKKLTTITITGEALELKDKIRNIIKNG